MKRIELQPRGRFQRMIAYTPVIIVAGLFVAALLGKHPSENTADFLSYAILACVLLSLTDFVWRHIDFLMSRIYWLEDQLDEINRDCARRDGVTDYAVTKVEQRLSAVEETLR